MPTLLAAILISLGWIMLFFDPIPFSLFDLHTLFRNDLNGLGRTCQRYARALLVAVLALLTLLWMLPDFEQLKMVRFALALALALSITLFVITLLLTFAYGVERDNFPAESRGSDLIEHLESSTVERKEELRKRKTSDTEIKGGTAEKQP